MPWKACRDPFCKTLIPLYGGSAYCPEHKPPPRKERGTKPWYQTLHWRTLRLQVMTDQPVCAGWPEGTECIRPTEEVDHVVAVESGATFKERRQLMFSRANCIGYCHSCHSKKTATVDRVRRHD